LKRPGGGVSVTVPSGGGSSLSPEPIFSIEENERPGGVWSAISLVSMLVLIGLVVVQVMTMNGATY
jgi:hypothetical protein